MPHFIVNKQIYTPILNHRKSKSRLEGPEVTFILLDATILFGKLKYDTLKTSKLIAHTFGVYIIYSIHEFKQLFF